MLKGFSRVAKRLSKLELVDGNTNTGVKGLNVLKIQEFVGKPH